MTGNDIIEHGLEYLGVPYVWGGETPKGGMDCSGFVYRVLRDCGMKVPRLTAQGYYDSALSYSVHTTKNGDLLFFGKSKSNITHIGFYYNGKLLESGGGDSSCYDLAHAGIGVRVRSIRSDLVAIKRMSGIDGSNNIQKGGNFYVEFPLIKRNQKNMFVGLAQRLLAQRGYYKDRIDNSYGTNTYNAVKKFQTDNPLCGSADGECGVKTWPVLLGIK